MKTKNRKISKWKYRYEKYRKKNIDSKKYLKKKGHRKYSKVFVMLRINNGI